MSMYKTVRHGENSLQYTILPQTDGALIPCGPNCRRLLRPRKVPHEITKEQKYLVIGAFVAIALFTLVYVPLFIIKQKDNALGRLQHDFRVRCAPHTPPEKEIVKSRKKELKISPEILSTLKLETTASAVQSASNSPFEKPTPPWTQPAVRAWKDGATSTPTDFLQGVPRIGAPRISLGVGSSPRPWDKDVIIRPTLTPTTVRDVFRYYSLPAPVTAKVNDLLVSTRATTGAPAPSQSSKFNDLKDTLLSADDDEDFKEAIEVDEVFNLRPSSVDGVDVKVDSNSEVTVTKANGETWLLPGWPYINTPYIAEGMGLASGRQSYLVPLLVATVSALALVLLLLISVRAKRSPTSQKESVVDDMPSVNTNLLGHTEDAE